MINTTTKDLPTWRELDADAIRRMRDDGMSWEAIGNALGVSCHTAKRAADPEYSARRREMNAAARRLRRKNAPRYQPHFVENRAGVVKDFMRLLAEVPADTRSLTARMFGDPLPGRSALDQRGQHQ